MKVESFYCEHTNTLFKNKGAEKSALEYAISILKQNYNQGYVYKCNYDALVEIKTGCWRKVLRFITGKKKEEKIVIKFKYGIFNNFTNFEKDSFDFIEVHPVLTEHKLSAFADKSVQNPYLETGKIAVQNFVTANAPKITPYCDLEVMVKVKPGCILKIWHYLTGNSYKNTFCFEYYEFNIAQKFN